MLLLKGQCINIALVMTPSRWFGMRIDTITSIFITIVALASIPVASSKYNNILTMIFIIICSALNAGLVGLSLAYAVSLNGAFQYCIRQSTEVESLVSEVDFDDRFSVL